MKKLEWYAFYYDFNTKNTIYTNVIRDELIEKVQKALKKGKNYQEIREEIRSNLIYHYWSKSEYEIVVTGLSEHDTERKLDIWYQLAPNLNRITEYMIRELSSTRKSNKILGGENEDLGTKSE